MKHQVIGQGTYGCIHNKSLLCQNTDINKNSNYVSKVMLKRYGNDEIEINKIIDNIDKDNLFHLGMSKECKIQDSVSNRRAINLCKKSKYIDSKIITNNALLLMKHGGINLDAFACKLRKINARDSSVQLMKNFWIEAYRLLLGVEMFQRKDFIHHDIKPQNIVFDEKEMRLNYIDFGLSGSIEEIINKCKKSRNSKGGQWWSYPPEYRYINKMDFDRRKNESICSILQSTHVTGFLPYIVNNKDFYKHDLEWLSNFGYKDYNKLLDKCMKTFDSYCVGFTLLLILDSGRHLMDPYLWKDLNELLYSAITPRYMDRIEINTLLSRYKEVIKKHNL